VYFGCVARFRTVQEVLAALEDNDEEVEEIFI